MDPKLIQPSSITRRILRVRGGLSQLGPHKFKRQCLGLEKLSNLFFCLHSPPSILIETPTEVTQISSLFVLGPLAHFVFQPLTIHAVLIFPPHSVAFSSSLTRAALLAPPPSQPLNAPPRHPFDPFFPHHRPPPRQSPSY